MPPFAQFLCQTQILILKILNVFLWLKFSPSLALNKIERFSKVSRLAWRASSQRQTVTHLPFKKIGRVGPVNLKYFSKNRVIRINKCLFEFTNTKATVVP
jgi:hypothetical protein